MFLFFIDQCSENSSLVYLVIQVRVPHSFACHAVFSNEFAPRSPGTMAAEDEEEILKSLRAQSRSVSFITGSELVVKFPHSPILHYAFSSWIEKTMTKTIDYHWEDRFVSQ